MKTIFLDIDGVLNNQDFYERIKKNRVNFSVYDVLGQYTNNIAQECLNRLNTIIEQTGAKVVLSSTWRQFASIKDTNNALTTLGFKGEIIDFTPDYVCRPYHHGDFTPQYEESIYIRGVEIFAWMKKNIPKWHKKDNEDSKYLILDDDEDMLYFQKNNFIQTDREFGLQDADVEKSLKILS